MSRAFQDAGLYLLKLMNRVLFYPFAMILIIHHACKLGQLLRVDQNACDGIV